MCSLLQERTETVDLSSDPTLLVDISDALSEKDKVKFTVHTKVTKLCVYFLHLARAHTHTTVLQPSWTLSGTTWVSQHRKGKTNLDLLEQEIVSGSNISWAICKFAP